MDSAQLINQDSGNFEWYTPEDIVERARAAMGSITLDPFSSAVANKRVGADFFFTEEDDAFTKDWFGNVWMNHPFGRDYNKRAIEKLVAEYEKGNIDQACCITFAATSEAWFRPLLEYPQCYIHGRTNYYLPDGTKKKGVTKGSVVTYLGSLDYDFYEEFRDLGTIKVDYGQL
jgi:hypothetical protein